MAAQLVRGRAARENLKDFVVETNRHLLRLAAVHYTDMHWMRAVGEVPSAEQVRRMAENEKYIDIKPSNALLLKTLLSTVDEVAELLFRRTFTLVQFEEPCLFTGENPVVHINPSGEDTGFGVVTAEQMYMPVSPIHALVLSHPWAGWPEESVTGTWKLAARLNWFMLIYPNNDELLMHPDVEGHALPGAGHLARGRPWMPRPWWPAGPDPAARPPVFLEFSARRRALERGDAVP